MTRRAATGLPTVALPWLLICSGCQPESKPPVAPATNGADYGENKMPPADKVAPRPGKAAKTPGAPPLRR